MSDLERAIELSNRYFSAVDALYRIVIRDRPNPVIFRQAHHDEKRSLRKLAQLRLRVWGKDQEAKAIIDRVFEFHNHGRKGINHYRVKGRHAHCFIIATFKLGAS